MQEQTTKNQAQGKKISNENFISKTVAHNKNNLFALDNWRARSCKNMNL